MPDNARLLSYRNILPLAAAFCYSIAQAAPPATVQWDAPVEIAAGPGERGPWQQNDSRFRYVDDGAVAAASDGRLYVAWVDQSAKDVMFRALDAAGKPSGETVNISRNGDTFSWLPRIAVFPGQPDVVIVAWQEIIFAGGAHGGDILVARSTDGGASFSGPQNISASIGGDGKGRISRDIWHNGSMDIAAGGDGEVHLAWTEYDGQLWHSRSRDGGQSFTPPRQLAGSRNSPARAPTLAIGRDGAIYLAWTTGENKSADILFSRSLDRGASFTPAKAVEKTPGYSDAPKLAVDEFGTLHLAWAESEGGPFDRSRIRYARSKDYGTTWSGIRSQAAVAPATSAGFPYLALHGRDQVVLAWEQFAKPGVRPRGLGYMVSVDGGKHFGRAAVVPGSVDPEGRSNGSFQGLLMEKLAVTPDGTIAVVNSALKDEDSSRVWMLRGRLR